MWRRGWDSNPCVLADKRFSRPPRYDHFDTSPYFLTCPDDFIIIPYISYIVKAFFKIFLSFFIFIFYAYYHLIKVITTLFFFQQTYCDLLVHQYADTVQFQKALTLFESALQFSILLSVFIW